MFKFHLKPNIQIRIFVGTVALAIIFMLGLASPAGAIWGESGPDEPLPVLFGIKLGDSVYNYPDLYYLEWVRPEGTLFSDYYLKFSPEKGKDLNAYYKMDVRPEMNFEGFPISKLECAVREEIITGINFRLSLEHYDELIDYLIRTYGKQRACFFDGLYNFGNYEIYITTIRFERDGEVSVIFKYTGYLGRTFIDRKYDPPRTGRTGLVDYRGVSLGGRIEEYPFLIFEYTEPSGVSHFRHKEPSMDVGGGDTYDEDYEVYEGVVFRISFSQKLLPKYNGHYLRLCERYGEMHGCRDWVLGDVFIYEYPNHDVEYIHLPTHWRAERARFQAVLEE